MHCSFAPSPVKLSRLCMHHRRTAMHGTECEFSISMDVGTSASCRWVVSRGSPITHHQRLMPTWACWKYVHSFYFVHNHQSQIDTQNVCEGVDPLFKTWGEDLLWILHKCILILSLLPNNSVAIVRGGLTLGSSPKQQATKWIDRVKNRFKCSLATRCFSVLKAVNPSRWLFKVPHQFCGDVRRQKATWVRGRLSSWPEGIEKGYFALSIMSVLLYIRWQAGTWMSL